MTLLVALEGRDGLVLSADSRGTFGDPRDVTAQNDAMKKAHILAPHVAVLQAGSGEVGAVIVQRLAAELAGTNMDGATPVMSALRERARNDYSEWFPSVPPIGAPALVASGQAPVRPNLAFIVAGYETGGEHGEGPKIFQLGRHSDFSPMLHDYGFAVAGVPQYALYLLNRLYERDRSVEELTAVYTITETASQDGKVGGPVNVITVTPDGGCVELDANAVSDVMSGNEARSRALRDSFYEQAVAHEQPETS